ncbi:MAG: carbohydrate ABC transporter permease, partial [Planktomarina sp.]
MKHKTFFWFFLPTGLAMLLFIAMPIFSVITQSIFTPHEAVLIEVENCGPFGCQTETAIDQEATAAVRDASPIGRFVGTQIYFDRGHLAVNEVATSWNSTETFGEFWGELTNLPFYRALYFTLVYTFTTVPILMMLGFAIAVAVNSLHRHLKGLMIFFSLLPMIVNPLIGSLILFWMVDSRGILGNLISYLAADPTLSVKASTPMMWVSIIIYGIWHSAPFAFVVFYAGLQTVNEDTLEAAKIDGATRWQQIRYVVIPHIMPLVTFVALIKLMDN